MYVFFSSALSRHSHFSSRCLQISVSHLQDNTHSCMNNSNYLILKCVVKSKFRLKLSLAEGELRGDLLILLFFC